MSVDYVRPLSLAPPEVLVLVLLLFLVGEEGQILRGAAGEIQIGKWAIAAARARRKRSRRRR